MKSARKNRNRAAIGVVAGIVDELIVEGQRRPFIEAVSVVGFDDLLSAVVELAVANQNAEATGGEISAGLARETFYDAGDADLVVRPSPRCTSQHRAEGKTLGAIRPAENFSLSRAPCGPRENAEITSDGLLEIGDNAVIG